MRRSKRFVVGWSQPSRNARRPARGGRAATRRSVVCWPEGRPGATTAPREPKPLRAWPLRLVSVAVVVGVSLLGQTGVAAAEGRVGIRPFSQVEVGRTHLQLAANGRSAIVQVTTEPPTVCAIAYGRTDVLGSIADDPNMGGTAIARHTVVLGGLQPGRTYYYRLTATDARGRVFQSRRLVRFTTPTPARAGSKGADVAIGAKVLAVSSQWSSAYKAANAVDGSLTSAWASNGDGNHAFITIELKRSYHVTGVAFITRQMADGSAITRTFAVVDGHRRYGPFPAGAPADPRVAHVRFVGRVLRFEVVTSTGGNTGADEIEVFAST